MKKLILLAAAALSLAACDKNNDNPLASTNAVQVSASIGETTLSRAIDTKWTAGDQIGITATSGFAQGRFTNMMYTTDGGNGFTGNPIYFYNPMTLTAYYPFTGKEGTAPGIIPVSTTADNQASDKPSGIDFLYAGETGIDIIDDKPVINFSFSHKMCKLTFIFKNGNDGTDVSKIKTYSIDKLLLDGTFDTASGICATNTDAIAKTLSINLPEGSVKTGEAVFPLIVLPQSTADKNITLKIKDSENQDYACSLTFADNEIKAGNNYQFTITVSKTGLTVNQSGITDWNTIISSDENKADAINPEET